MVMAPRLRKLVLTAHVASSVGWLGAVLAYIALDVTAITSHDSETVRSAHLAMGLIVWSAIVPLALTSVLIGVVNALGSPWGLFRHWWVVTKLLLTLFATTILLLETQTIDHLAQVSATSASPQTLPGTLPHSIGGLVVLVTTTILSIYKPRGLTRYGWRKQQQQRRQQQRKQPTASVP